MHNDNDVESYGCIGIIDAEGWRCVEMMGMGDDHLTFY